MGTNHRIEAVEDKQGEGSSSKHLTKFEVNSNEVKPLSRHGSSASSSSSSSSHQDLVNGNNDEDKPLGKSEQPQAKSAAPFRVSFVSSNELSPDPPMAAGGQGYVPSRIPSSIFGKPATAMDWSTASNESLFSIHVGNGSFSKDQFFALYKSGELTKLDEQIIAQGNVLPSLKELEDMAAKNENIEMSNKTMAVERSEEVEEEHSKLKKKFSAGAQNSRTHSISGLSDVSNNSTLSFAFPVLSGTDAGRVSSANGDQNKGLQLQTQSVKQQEDQQQQQQVEQKKSTKDLPPQTPVTPQNASNRSWFSRVYCCRCS